MGTALGGEGAAPDVLALIEQRLIAAFGEPTGRAAVTFVGTERIEMLRFTAADPPSAKAPQPETAVPRRRLVRYATVGMARRPMTDPLAAHADPLRGPRAELLLTLRGGHDEVVRVLAAFAASPQVDGLVVAPGALLDAGEPLWPRAPFSAVLVAEPGGLVEDLELDPPADPVRFLPVLPVTAQEAAFKRARGAAELWQRWLRHGTDLRDPERRTVPLVS